MIRLATAHAKCRLRNEITQEDARVALELMNFALYAAHAMEASQDHLDIVDMNQHAGEQQADDKEATSMSVHANGNQDDDDDDDDDERTLQLPIGKKPILGKRSRAASTFDTVAPPAQRRRLRPDAIATTTTTTTNSSSNSTASLDGGATLPSTTTTSTSSAPVGEISQARYGCHCNHSSVGSSSSGGGGGDDND
jgi:hypothetical protein